MGERVENEKIRMWMVVLWIIISKVMVRTREEKVGIKINEMKFS